MKNKIIGLFVLSIFLLAISFGTALESTSDEMTVKANILQSEIGVSVPSEMLFQDITSGYISERKDLNIENIGTVDIEITPQLSETYVEGIFDNLVFHEVLSDPMTKIRFFSFDIEKPSTVGGVRTSNLYMYLDLQEYSGDIGTNMLNHETKVIFWAVPS